MTPLTEAIASLRTAFAVSPGIATIELHGAADALDAVELGLAVPVELSELEAAFGPASALPVSTHGEHRVQFVDTFPETGPGCTVLAVLGDDGKVGTVVLRPERD